MIVEYETRHFAARLGGVNLRTLRHSQTNSNLEPGASKPEVTARIIGVERLIEQLAPASPQPPDAWQALSHREEIYA